MNEGKTRLGKFDKWGYTNMFSKKELARELVYTNEDNNNLRQEIERLNNIINNSKKILDKIYDYTHYKDLPILFDDLYYALNPDKLKELKGNDKNA